MAEKKDRVIVSVTHLAKGGYEVKTAGTYAENMASVTVLLQTILDGKTTHEKEQTLTAVINLL